MGPAKWPISGLLSAEYPMISVNLRVPAPPHVRATAGPRRATPPPQGIHATTPLSASCDAPPRKDDASPPAPVARSRRAAGRRTPPPCAPQLACRLIVTGWPAIVAHAATGRADAATHGYAPGRPSRQAGRQRPMNAHSTADSRLVAALAHRLSHIPTRNFYLPVNRRLRRRNRRDSRWSSTATASPSAAGARRGAPGHNRAGFARSACQDDARAARQVRGRGALPMNGGVEHAAKVGAIDRTAVHADSDGQVKQGEQEVLHARDSVGPTSGATQRCLKPGCSERIGNSRRTGRGASSRTGRAGTLRPGRGVVHHARFEHRRSGRW